MEGSSALLDIKATGSVTLPPPSKRIAALILCFMAMLADGFDLAIMPLAMPAIADQWHLARSAPLGLIFSSSIAGVMVGAPVLGNLADRRGRKAVFIASLLLFGAASLAIMRVVLIPQLVILRFITGVGIGGALPLGIVISAELTPVSWRGRIVAIVSTGATVGAAIAGFASGLFLPLAGWTSLFAVGGVLPVLLALIATVTLPSKIGLPRSRRAAQDEDAFPSALFGDLFHGRLRTVTPILWMLFALIGLSIVFIQSWGPMLLAANGYRTSDIALALGLFGVTARK